MSAHSIERDLDISAAVTEQLAQNDARREHLVRLLRDSGGNMARAADELGVARNSLYRMIARYGLCPRDYRTTRSAVARNAMKELKRLR